MQQSVSPRNDMRPVDGHFGPSWWLVDTDDRGKWPTVYGFLFSSNHGSIWLGFWDTDVVTFSSYHSSKTHRFWARDMRRTNRKTDRRTDRLTDTSVAWCPHFRGGGIITPCFLHYVCRRNIRNQCRPWSLRTPLLLLRVHGRASVSKYC